MLYKKCTTGSSSGLFGQMLGCINPIFFEVNYLCDITDKTGIAGNPDYNDNSPVISKIVKPPPPSRRTRSPAREHPQTQYKPVPPKREKSPAAAPRHKKAVPPLPAKNCTSGSFLDSIATNPSARKSLRHAVYSQYVHDSPADSGQHLSPTLENNHVPRTSTGRQTRGFSYLGAGGINPADIQLRKTAGDRKKKPLETQF